MAPPTLSARPESQPYVGFSGVALQRVEVGVEFATKIIKADDGTVIKAQIWDTAGQGLCILNLTALGVRRKDTGRSLRRTTAEPPELCFATT
eukprot:scaffold1130_cov195-Pinguiococcus_pyrenoidosus.AAC.57